MAEKDDDFAWKRNFIEGVGMIIEDTNGGDSIKEGEDITIYGWFEINECENALGMCN